MILYIIFNCFTKKSENFIEEKIPKIIHQTWKTTDLPYNFKIWSDNLKNDHPDWKYILWTDEDNRNLIKNYYPWFLKTYDEYDVNIKRVDAARYFYLYHYGGVYIDMDMTSLKKLDNLIENNNYKLIFGYQLRDKYKRGSIANAFMVSTPKHTFIKSLIDNLEKTKNKHVLMATGPSFLTYHIKEYDGNDIKIYEMPIIYNIEATENDKKKLKNCDTDLKLCKKDFPDSYLVTFWTNTWSKK